MTAPARRFDGLRSVVVIGGGDLMLHAARAFRDRGAACAAVFAPRHAEEPLAIDGRVTQPVFAEEGFATAVADDMGADRRWQTLVTDKANALALCFGPAWVFPREVMGFFGLGMLNFNGIPIPRYLGGAHYSWQILNGDRSGGCILQEITENLDRGDILRAEYFDLPGSVRVPRDYFIANFERGRTFIDQLAADMLAGVAFSPRPMADLDAGRLYFPRLLTGENAFIDWSWDAEQVVRFCNAFDDPYAGAGTSLGDRLVRLRDVSRAEGGDDFHPFTAGLVVRRAEDAVYVAARGGLLRCGQVVDGASGESCLAVLREGMLLHTGAQRLEKARLFRPRIGAAGLKGRTGQ